MDDDLERPAMPIWIWLVVALLAVVGAFTILRWMLGAVFGLLKLGVAVAFVALVIAAAGSFVKRK